MNTIAVQRTLPNGEPCEGCLHIVLGGGATPSKGNIVSFEMMTEIMEALSEVDRDSHVKAVAFTAVGKHFSFGASVEEHRSEPVNGTCSARDMIAQFHEVILQIARTPVPVVSVVSGYCLGGAMELVLAGSIVFADSTAMFGQPEIQLGVFPPPASVLLPLKLGYSRAEPLLLSGAMIDAKQAVQLGLINYLIDADKKDPKAMLHTEASTWIREHLIARSASSLRLAIRAERMRLIDILETELPILERLYIDELMATHDANEGIAAFLEKRPPVWVNA